MTLSQIADRVAGRIPDNHVASHDDLIDLIDLISGGELDYTQVGIVLDMVLARLKARQHHDVA